MAAPLSLQLLLLLWLTAAATLGVPYAAALSAADAAQQPRQPLDAQRENKVDDHSFEPPILAAYYGEGDLTDWIVAGSTVVTDSYVRLTPRVPSTTGHLWNRVPFLLDRFEISFAFRMHPYHGVLGDGFGLWLTSGEPVVTVGGPLMGHPNDFRGIGILFDAYDNDNKKDNPKITLLANLAEASYRTPYHPETDFLNEGLGSCTTNFLSRDDKVMTLVRVHYDQGRLRLFITREGGKEETCFDVSGVALDALPRPLHLGFTAATGGVYVNHDIHYVRTRALSGADYEEQLQRMREQGDQQPGRDAEAFDNKVAREEQQQQQQQQPNPDNNNNNNNNNQNNQNDANKPTGDAANLEAMQRELEALRAKLQQENSQTPPPPPPPSTKHNAKKGQQQEQQQQQQQPEEEEQEEEEEEEEEDETTTTKKPRKRRARTNRGKK